MQFCFPLKLAEILRLHHSRSVPWSVPWSGNRFERRKWYGLWSFRISEGSQIQSIRSEIRAWEGDQRSSEDYHSDWWVRGVGNYRDPKGEPRILEADDQHVWWGVSNQKCMVCSSMSAWIGQWLGTQPFETQRLFQQDFTGWCRCFAKRFN